MSDDMVSHRIDEFLEQLKDLDVKVQSHIDNYRSVMVVEKYLEFQIDLSVTGFVIVPFEHISWLEKLCQKKLVFERQELEKISLRNALDRTSDAFNPDNIREQVRKDMTKRDNDVEKHLKIFREKVKRFE